MSADEPDGKNEGFLSRWARLKTERSRARPQEQKQEQEQKQKQGQEQRQGNETAPQVSGSPAAGSPISATEGEPASPTPDLPDPRTLTAESDYGPFLKEGVSDVLRKAALRRLWSTDPAWASPDPLDIHNLDYRRPVLGAAVKSAWKAGKGYADKFAAADRNESENQPEKRSEENPPSDQTADTPPQTEISSEDIPRDSSPPDNQALKNNDISKNTGLRKS